MLLYQYFVEVVPTDIQTLLSTSKTYQYSVKDHQRPINHQKGSHGSPGIFFKYDMSALKIKVTQQRDTVCQFLVKLCATVGGIFVTSGKFYFILIIYVLHLEDNFHFTVKFLGLVKNIVQSFWYVICCKFLANKENKNDQIYPISSINSNYQMIGTINLLNVPAPENVNIMFKPQ